VNLIPDRIQPVLKSWVAGLGAIATALIALAPGLPTQWQIPLAGVLAVATAYVTWLMPNLQRFIDQDEYEGSPPDVVAAPVPDASPDDVVTPADPDQPAAGVPPSDTSAAATEPDGAVSAPVDDGAALE